VHGETAAKNAAIEKGAIAKLAGAFSDHGDAHRHIENRGAPRAACGRRAGAASGPARRPAFVRDSPCRHNRAHFSTFYVDFYLNETRVSKIQNSLLRVRNAGGKDQGVTPTSQ